MKPLKEKTQYAIKKYGFTMLASILPNIVILMYSIPDLKRFIKLILISINLYDFCNKYKIIIILILLIPVPFVFSKIESNYEYNTNRTNVSLLKKLLVAIEHIIDEKRRRFQQGINNSENKTKEEVFLDIIKPKTQMMHILTNMTAFLIQITDDNTIKSSLISCQNNQLKNFFIQTDDLPKISIEDLTRDSLAKKALDSRKTMIENDTRGSKIFWNDSDRTSIKSIICHPIFNGNKIDFIMSITSKNVDCFKIIQTEQLKWLLIQFEHRICVENHLLQLRGDA
jgi:putative methionine-R-sulfoxide reductase with GAF domain